MVKKSFVVVVAYILSAALAACGGKPKERPGSTVASGRTAPPATVSNAPAAPVHIEKFALGYDLGPAGEVSHAGDTFGKGEKAFVSFAMVDAKPKAQARVVFLTKPDGVKVAEETKTLPDNGLVSYVVDTKSWAIGAYSLVISVIEPGEAGPRDLGTALLTIAASRSK